MHIYLLNSFIFKSNLTILRSHFILPKLCLGEGWVILFCSRAGLALSVLWEMTQVDLRGALTSHYWIPVAGEEEAVSPLPDLPMPTQEMPVLCLSMDSALGTPVAHLGSGREVRREEANQIPASIRGNGEKQLQSAPEGRPGKTLQLELTQRTFQILKPRCPVRFFFFCLIQLLGWQAFPKASSWREFPGSWSGMGLGS